MKTLPIPERGRPDSAFDLQDKQVCGSTKRPTGREEEKGAGVAWGVMVKGRGGEGRQGRKEKFLPGH